MADSINQREIVLDILLDIDKNNTFSNEAINKVLRKYQYLPKANRAYITRVCEGVTEKRITIDYIINQYSKTKVNKLKNLIRCVLRMAVYEIMYMDSIPESASCNEAVKLCKKRGLTALSGFVNGVLRNIQRNHDNIVWPDCKNSYVEYLSVYYSMPQWIVLLLINQYGKDIALKVIESTMKDRGISIRISNSANKSEVVKGLEAQEVSVRNSAYFDNALILNNINYVGRLEGFFEGLFTIQDESSMLIGHIASPKPNSCVVDVCSAPGGKTTHVADLLDGTGVVIARDISEDKVALIEENVDRLKLKNVNCQVYDATVYDPSLEGKADIVIADLPCSGLGVMGRKNDIKYRITKEDLDALRDLQRQILSTACSYVKKGGKLIFSTCTINKEENIENAQWFRDNYAFEYIDVVSMLPDRFKEELKTAYDIEETPGYITILPGICDCDGFFVAAFTKL